MNWASLLASYFGSSGGGGGSGGANAAGYGGAAGYGLANTSGPITSGAQSSGPLMTTQGDSTYVIATGGSKASGPGMNPVLLVGGVLVGIILWKKLK